jgi:hypothetical protein
MACDFDAPGGAGRARTVARMSPHNIPPTNVHPPKCDAARLQRRLNAHLTQFALGAADGCFSFTRGARTGYGAAGRFLHTIGGLHEA